MGIKKYVMLMIMVLTLALVIAACASQGGRPQQTQQAVTYSQEKAPSPDKGQPEANQTAGGDPTSSDISIRKLVKNVDTTIQVEDTKASYDSILKQAEAMGGYLVSSNISDYDGRKFYNLSVRVPAEKLQEFLDYLEGLGRIVHQNINTEDITEQYYDAQARLDNALIQEAQLKDIMKQAKTVDEILKVKQQMDSVQERIEQLKGQLKLWDQLTAMSLVNIELQPSRETVAVSKYVDWNILSGNEIAVRIRNGFVSTLNFIVNLALYLVIFIISALPAILIIILIIFLIRKYRPFKLPHLTRRNRKKQE